MGGGGEIEFGIACAERFTIPRHSLPFLAIPRPVLTFPLRSTLYASREVVVAAFLLRPNVGLVEVEAVKCVGCICLVYYVIVRIFVLVFECKMCLCFCR